MMARALVRSVIALASIATVACSGPPEIYEVAPSRGATRDLDAIELPEPEAAVPAYLVTGREPMDSTRLGALRPTPGAAVVAPLSMREVRVTGATGVVRLRAAIVDPLVLRPVTPLTTRDAEFVWIALLGGDAVLTPAAVERVGLDSSNRVKIEGLGSVWVGAVADNGTPNVADVLLPRDSFGDVWGGPHAVVVGAESGITLESLAEDLEERAPGAELTRLAPRGPALRAPPPAPVAPAPAAAGLHPTLAASVQRLIERSGGRIWLVSGYRDYAHQYALWSSALRRYRDPERADNWVAPPGHSMHERGLAVDLGGDLALAARLVEELDLPLWRPMSWEPWHFELVGSRG